MKPLHVVATVAGTDRGRSGLGTWVRCVMPRLAMALTERGGRLTLVGTRADLEAYPEIPATRITLDARYDAPAASALWHLAWAGEAARRAGADVLLLPAANRRLSVPLRAPPAVAVVHDLAAMHVRGKFDHLRMFYNREVVPRVVARAQEIVSVSHATARDLATVLPRGTRVRVVPNGVEAQRFTAVAPDDPTLLAVRSRLGVAGPYVLYPSRLEHPGKNHRTLFDAFARSKASRDHALVLAGRDWGAEAMLREHARDLGIERRVVFAGYVADHDLPALVAGAAAVAVVGLWEGFGLPALEALASGRPVVVADAGALPEATGTLGLKAPPLDAEALARALDRALNDEVLRAHVSREGPRWAAAHSWERTSAGILDACDAAGS